MSQKQNKQPRSGSVVIVGTMPDIIDAITDRRICVAVGNCLRGKRQMTNVYACTYRHLRTFFLILALAITSFSATITGTIAPANWWDYRPGAAASVEAIDWYTGDRYTSEVSPFGGYVLTGIPLDDQVRIRVVPGKRATELLWSPEEAIVNVHSDEMAVDFVYSAGAVWK